MLPALQKEYDKAPRLKQKFPWVNSKEFEGNRARSPHLSNRQRRERGDANKFLWEHVQTELPGPSRIDVEILSYCYVLSCPVVTDDSDMAELAEVFEIEIINTVRLLDLMLTAGHIDIHKVRSISSYLHWLDDLPKDFKRDYKKTFNEGAAT